MEDAKVWGVFVGDKGDKLEVFNSQHAPFPPEPGSTGYIAIGWPAIGDMKLYKNNYADYIEKFRMVYPHEDERAFKTQANIPWKFAFNINEGDWVICPSSTSGYLLVGKIEGEYIPNFHGDRTLPHSNARADFIHLRKVKWLYIVSEKDNRYNKLHRIGRLTVVQPKNVASISELKSILDGNA